MEKSKLEKYQKEERKSRWRERDEENRRVGRDYTGIWARKTVYGEWKEHKESARTYWHESEEYWTLAYVRCI